jgi:hypothetical protein
MVQATYPLIGDYINILCIDGVGFHSLSGMFALEHTLKDVAHDPGAEEEPSPRPCEYFDLIGGSSGGALLALMLGPMEMTCQEARTMYEGLARASHTRPPGSAARDQRASFREALEALANDRLSKPDAEMTKNRPQENGHICHVSVTTKVDGGLC